MLWTRSLAAAGPTRRGRTWLAWLPLLALAGACQGPGGSAGAAGAPAVPSCPPCPAAPSCPPCPVAPSCPPCPTGAGAGVQSAGADSEAQRTERFLDEQTPRYRAALARARHWLDGLRVDPAELSHKGIKGKKKLVELLDTYYRLHQIAAAAERPALLARLRAVAAPTYEPGYHDLLVVSDAELKQNSTSYLRAAYLLERAGLDTALYRREIARAQPRLDAQMGRRGPHQRMAFHWYYQHFGLKEPFDLSQGYRAGVIARRVDPYELRERLKSYDLTHEVFVPYRFGEDLAAQPFGAEEREYLRRALERLTVHWIMMDNADLVAELCSCLRYLRQTDGPVFREALAYLLAAQRPEGTWGEYERYRARFGDFVDQGFYLHTTAVALDALTVAFDPSLRQRPASP